MSESFPPNRAITRGPKYHWFGYYDKLQFDPTGRYALGMEVDFEHRSPRPDDSIGIGIIDLENGDHWTELGQSCAWCWQQGCMLQWRPGAGTEILWNDRHENRFVCQVLDTRTGKKRTLPRAIYTVSPDGRTGLSVDFRRINDMRPGYGYAGLPDPNRNVLAPEDSGISRVDLETGAAELIVTIADVARIPYPHRDLSTAKHYFNHLLFNPDGTRFEFLHRWRFGSESFQTRMMTAALDGSDMRVVDDSGHTSHFIWRDRDHILAWSYHSSHGFGFYLFRDGTLETELVGAGGMTENGHCSYLPGNEWVLNDTYPGGAHLEGERNQQLYLYHVASGAKVLLGRFDTAPEYSGEWRCDLHPRFSPDGQSIVIDSVHAGNGRQMVLLDISGILNQLAAGH